MDEALHIDSRNCGTFRYALFAQMLLLNELIIVRLFPFVCTSVPPAKSIQHFIKLRNGASIRKVARQIAFEVGWDIAPCSPVNSDRRFR